LPHTLELFHSVDTMFLTNCAAFAAPLDLDHNPRCMRCKTRYCNATCQHDHWRRGHKQVCKKIHRGGNADNTKGQTCYICLEAVHPRTGEGLVRGCVCRDRDGVASGTTGIAHVSCLAEQAKILMEQAEENNSDPPWGRWRQFGLCEHNYHGVVGCAMGWASFKTYVKRGDRDGFYYMTMEHIGTSLSELARHAEAVQVLETWLAMTRRNKREACSNDNHMLATAMIPLSNCYARMGRLKECLALQREIYSFRLKKKGKGNHETYSSAVNLASTLVKLGHCSEAKALLRGEMDQTKIARRHQGEMVHTSIQADWFLGMALVGDTDATLEEMREGVALYEGTIRTSERVLGQDHPISAGLRSSLEGARGILARREAGRPFKNPRADGPAPLFRSDTEVRAAQAAIKKTSK